MNKQIDEMARDLEDYACMSNFQGKIAAKNLHILGYRKASDVLKEVEKLGDLYQMPDGMGLVIKIKDFAELKKKYESEVNE